MTDHMIESLELLPQPAALFVCGRSAEFVARNAIAAHVFHELFPDGETLASVDDALRLIGLDRHLVNGHLLSFGTYSAEVERIGIVHFTRLPTNPGLSRPDLLLVTSHADVDHHTAWLDHNRMVLSLRVNESADIAMRTLENTLVQVEGALSVQRDMLQMYNARMSEFFGSPPPKKV